MPRHQPLGRPSPDEVIDGMTVRMRRDADGKLVPIAPERKATPTTEAKPDPRDQPDPRSGPMRNIPPFGGGV